MNSAKCYMSCVPRDYYGVVMNLAKYCVVRPTSLWISCEFGEVSYRVSHEFIYRVVMNLAKCRIMCPTCLQIGWKFSTDVRIKYHMRQI